MLYWIFSIESAFGFNIDLPPSQLSLAIGNKGQNARLAVKLTGWKIDIKPESGFYGENPIEHQEKPAEDQSAENE